MLELAEDAVEARAAPGAFGRVRRSVVMNKMCGGDEGGVVVAAEPGAAFEVVEPEPGFQFAVVVLGTPPDFSDPDEFLQRCLFGTVALTVYRAVSVSSLPLPGIGR